MIREAFLNTGPGAVHRTPLVFQSFAVPRAAGEVSRMCHGEERKPEGRSHTLRTPTRPDSCLEFPVKSPFGNRSHWAPSRTDHLPESEWTPFLLGTRCSNVQSPT